MNEDKARILLGLNIKRLRERKGYTQEAFCELISLTQPNLSNIETGKSFPSFPTFFSMMEVLEVNPNDMFEFLQKYKDIDFSDELDVEIFNTLLSLPYKTKQIINAINQA